jgi:hypothetical protein
MGQMKWVYEMVIDGSYEDFKKEYIECVLRRKDKFYWRINEISKERAKNIIKFVDAHNKQIKLNKNLKDEIFSK